MGNTAEKGVVIELASLFDTAALTLTLTGWRQAHESFFERGLIAFRILFDSVNGKMCTRFIVKQVVILCFEGCEEE